MYMCICIPYYLPYIYLSLCIYSPYYGLLNKVPVVRYFGPLGLGLSSARFQVQFSVEGSCREGGGSIEGIWH